MTVDKNKPHYLEHRKRLRERFIRTGLEGFADYEIVELLLTLAIPRCDVKNPAKHLIARFGNVCGVLDASIKELQQIEGIGKVTPIALKIIRETATIYMQQSIEHEGAAINLDSLSSLWQMKIGALPNEVFEVAYLDSGYRLLCDGIERLEKGTIDRATIYPRQVIEAAFRHGAAAVVIAHNHPNGDVNPSEKDILLTRSLSLAAESVQLKIFDHLIISKNNWFSFRKSGLI